MNIELIGVDPHRYCKILVKINGELRELFEENQLSDFAEPPKVIFPYIPYRYPYDQNVPNVYTGTDIKYTVYQDNGSGYSTFNQ